MQGQGKGGPAIRHLALLLPVLALGCSQRTMSLFFDVPPEEEAPAAAEQPAPAPNGGSAPQGVAGSNEAQPERPAIEAKVTWEEARAALPKNGAGQVNWMAALQQGIIQPRKTIDGSEGPRRRDFGYDFYYPGASPTFDTYFPHSAHTAWVGCDSCHPGIFRERGTKVTMADIMAGKYCGVCHGSVAFGPTECGRCHPAMARG